MNLRSVGFSIPFVALAALAGSTLSAHAAIITVRSGQVGAVPGNVLQQDTNTRCRFIPNPLIEPVMNPAYFSTQTSWSFPYIVAPYLPPFFWTPDLGALDPLARWIDTDFVGNDNNGYAASVAYSAPFFVPGSGPIPATMTLKIAVDDSLGGWSISGDPNPSGVYLNGMALSNGTLASPHFTAANYNTPTVYTKNVILNGGVPNYLQLYQRDIGSAVAGIIFSADFNVPNSNGCTPKPSGLALWLPFDETSGTNSANAVNPAHPGVRNNGPITTPGKVSNALAFDGVNDYVNVATSLAYPGIDPGNGPFTIDAWVRKFEVDSTIQVLVDHRREGSGPVLGYSWFLGGNNNQALQLASPSGFVNWPGGPATAIPANNQWYFAAVVVNRGPTVSNPTATFYLNGLPVSTINISAVTGNINPPAGTPFRVGSRSSSVSGNFRGGIDEVEFFSRALTPTEIRQLYTAGAAGKCKTEVRAPVNSYCRNVSAITTTVYFSNFSGANAVYNWNFSTLGVGPGCTVSGPTGFSPSSGSTFVAAGQTIPLTVTITPLPGQPLNSTACYLFTATNTTTNDSTSAVGKISRICTSPDPTGSPLRVSTAETQIPLFISNEGRGTMQGPYRVRVVHAGYDDLETEDLGNSVSLNGLPPGEPVYGQIDIGSFGTAEIPLSAAFAAPEGNSLYAILLEADLDGDGTFEAVRSEFVTFSDPATDPCIADTDDGSGTGTRDGGVTIDDLLYYLQIFEAGDLAADVDDGSSTGTLDGGVTIDDLLYYLFRFEAGC